MDLCSRSVLNCWGIDAEDTELDFPCYVTVVILGVAVGFFSWSNILCLVLVPKIIVYVIEMEMSISLFLMCSD